jgi:UDP-N-acetylglucosamine 2-epimerase (non-hydrolysing)
MNLLREGIEGQRIFVTGNPILEVIQHYDPQIRESKILNDLGLDEGNYFLVTMHRAENVDLEPRLRSLIQALEAVHKEYRLPIICSTHPRTRAVMERFRVDTDSGQIRFCEPFGLFDFIALERNAFCVLSDSGTVQEECCLFRVPNVTIRDVTERPETIECGSNMLSGADPQTVLRCVRTVLDQRGSWRVPPEYMVENVSRTVAKIVLGYSSPSLKV